VRRREARFQCFGILKASRAEPGRRVEHLRKGNPAEVITRFVTDERIDAVVMGTVVRIGLPGFLIGNTAETVLDRVSCSLFTVKPDGFVSPVLLPPLEDPSGHGESGGTSEA
jgi:universal stress protein E